MTDLSGWLPGLLSASVDVQDNGEDVAKRDALNVVGAKFVDDVTNKRTTMLFDGHAHSMAELRARPFFALTKTHLLGYYAAGDGGGGHFWDDPTGTDADDGGLTILPTGHVGAGRRRRLVAGAEFHVEWFGAKADGTTDSHAAVQAAIDAAHAAGGAVSFPAGTVSVGTTTLSLTSDVTLLGEGQRISTILYSGTGDAILSQVGTLTPSLSVGRANNTIQSLSITNGGTNHAKKCGIHQINGAYFQVRDVAINGFDVGICLDGSESASVIDCYLASQVTCGVAITNGSSFTVGMTAGQSNVITIERTVFNSPANGIIDDGGIGHYFYGNLFAFCTTLAIEVNGTNTATIVGNYFEGAVQALGVNATQHWDAAAGGGTFVDFSDNTVTLPSGAGLSCITIAGGLSFISIDNNLLYPSSGHACVSGGSNIAEARWGRNYTGASSFDSVPNVLHQASGGNLHVGANFATVLDVTAAEAVFASQAVSRTGGTDGVTSVSLGDDKYRPFAQTVASASAVVLDTYTPPDESVVSVAWELAAKQTAGTGAPKGAVYHATIKVRRAGSALTVLDAASVMPGSGNEAAWTCSVDVTAAPAIELKLNTADAAITVLATGSRGVIGTPGA